MCSKGPGTGSNLPWDKNLGFYLSLGETSIWFEDENDYCEGILDLETLNHLDDDDVCSPECSCYERSISEELEELANRLNEHSLGEIDPTALTTSCLICASWKYGKRGYDWPRLISSPASFIECSEDSTQLFVRCGAGHIGSLNWCPQVGWTQEHKAKVKTDRTGYSRQQLATDQSNMDIRVPILSSQLLMDLAHL
jgi:hypothetical protein